MTTTRSARRGAFTTIELLVVIAIIAVLVALTTAGVQRVRVTANRVKAVSEIAQMSSAIQVFQRDKRVDFIPSSIILRENGDYNLSNNAEAASLTYLRQVWPQLTFPIDWNGDGTLAPMGTAWALEGDQCLVFFLGGPQGSQGFTGNPRNPIPPIPPIPSNPGKQSFEFVAARLIANGNAASSAGFPSFMDPFLAKPYAYSSSFGRKNGYNAGGDCPTIAPGFGPYRDTANSFYQPTGHQIFSAGYDKAFGIGGIRSGWSPLDNDNVTNFSNGQVSGLE